AEVGGRVGGGAIRWVGKARPAALVAVPAEVRLDHGELRVGVGAEPAAVHGQGFAGDLEHLLGVPLVAGQGQDADARVAGLGGELLVVGAGEQSEVADAGRGELDLLPAVAEV